VVDLPPDRTRADAIDGGARRAVNELGAPLDWRPAARPERRPLEGELVTLEPLDPGAHAAALFGASSGPAEAGLWDYLTVGPFASERDFARWAAAAAASDDPLFFAIVERVSRRASGVCSYLRITPEHGVIEIGNIWFARRLQRTRPATEAIFLLARHVFDELGYRRLEWKCDALNAPSRRAAERFGFGFEGVFGQHMVVKGRNRDTAWYALLDHEWPSARRAFELWLAPGNFDPEDRQRRSLRALRDSLLPAAASEG
jgi:RimJ/RimL family protein N-acetyltransferase